MTEIKSSIVRTDTHRVTMSWNEIENALAGVAENALHARGIQLGDVKSTVKVKIERETAGNPVYETDRWVGVVTVEVDHGEIPPHVYFFQDNFYTVEGGHGMGREFYKAWKPRHREFPGKPL